MTKKDYTRIAAAIARVRQEIADAGVLPVIDAIAGEIADECRQDNARFDRDRFLRACGVIHGE